MKTRAFAVLVAVMALATVIGWGVSSRADDAKSDSDMKCPVSGKPASKDHAVDYDGGKVYFCCDDCPKAFQKDPSKYAAKAHLQMALTGQLTQTACPFSHKPVNPEKTVDVGGVKVAFCCGDCVKEAQGMSQDDLIKKVFTDISKTFKVAESK